MAVGIRGTCGWVEVVDKNKARVFILEGTVQVAVIDPVTREVKVDIISGGDSASGVVYKPDTPGDKCDILRDRFSEEDVPGFALVEIVGDMKHVDEIFNKSKTDVDLRHLTRPAANKRLRKDQGAIDNDSQESNEGSRSESSGTSAPETPAPETPAPPEPVTLNVSDGLTVAQIQTRLNNGESVIVNGDFTVNGDLTVPADPSLTFNSPVEVESGRTVAVAGTMNTEDAFTNSGTVTIDGTVNANSGLTNNGQINVNSSHSLNVTGELKTQNDGKLTLTKTGKVKADRITGKAELEMGAQLLCKSISPAPIVKVEDNLALCSQRLSDQPDADGFKRYEHTAWKYENGTLTIAGQGEMKYSSTAPWYGQKENITTVEIQKGVTSIYQYAFFEYSRLTDVIIPEGVTSIGNDAFQNCTSLTGVEIPDSVTSIGIYAFLGCSSLASINVKEGNTAYYSVNGVLYTKSGNTLVIYPDKKQQETYVVPEGVTSIDDNAFSNCTGLSSVTIPESVKSIGKKAFNNCTRLSSVTILGGVESIGEQAFYGSGIYSVTIPESVKSIGNSAFQNCKSLQEVIIRNGLESIGENAFYNCDGLSKVEMPVSVKSIGNSAFPSSAWGTITYIGTKEDWNKIQGNDNVGSMRVIYSPPTATQTPKSKAALNSLMEEGAEITEDTASTEGLKTTENSKATESSKPTEKTETTESAKPEEKSEKSNVESEADKVSESETPAETETEETSKETDT